MSGLMGRVARDVPEDILIFVPENLVKEQKDLSESPNTQTIDGFEFEFAQRGTKLHAPAFQNTERQRDDDSMPTMIAALRTNQHFAPGTGAVFDAADNFLKPDIE